MMAVEVLIITRPLALSNTKLSRFIDPLAKKGRVVYLYKEPLTQLEFLYDLALEKGPEEKNFDSVMARTYNDIKPSDIFIHLQDQSSHLPVAYLARRDKDGRFKHIRKASADKVKRLLEE